MIVRSREDCLFTKKLLWATLAVVIFTSSDVVSDVLYDLKFERTLPDSISEGAITFDDYDGDGYDDFLIRGEYYIAVYSVKNNQTLEYFPLKSDSLPRNYAIGYIDQDGRPDFFEVVCRPGTFNTVLMGLIYLSTEGYNPPYDSILLFPTPVGGPHDGAQISGVGPVFLSLDSAAGTLKLIVRLEQFALIGDWPLEGYQTFYSYIKYLMSQDTVTEVASFPPVRNEFYNLYDNLGPESLDMLRWEYADCWWSMLPCRVTYYFSVRIFLQDSLLINEEIMPDTTLCSTAEYMYFYATNLGHWVSDILTSSPGHELLLLYSEAVETPPAPSECYTRIVRLACYSMSSPDSLHLIWNRPLPEVWNYAFVFSDSAYPDRFFAFADDRFYQASSENGQPVDSSSRDFADSVRMIAYRSLEAGGDNFAVLKSGQHLRFYTLDIESDAPEGDHANLPTEFRLGQPYPNPFNPLLLIPVTLPRKEHLRVEVFNLIGQKETCLFDAIAGPGNTEIRWVPEKFSSGIYLVRASAADRSLTKKVVLLK